MNAELQTPVNILAFLQNQWFKNPEAARRTFERYAHRRNDLIRNYLFMGCLTGKRLSVALGNLCDSIIWEECSTNIGGESAAAFPADLEHMQAAITKHNPACVLAFGKIATDAVSKLQPKTKVIYGPHPAARHGAMAGLHDVAQQLKAIISQGEKNS